MAVVKYKTWAELQKHNEEARKHRELEKLEKMKKEEEEKKTEEEVVVPQEKKVSKGRKPKNRAYMVVEEVPAPVIEEIKEEEKTDEE